MEDMDTSVLTDDVEIVSRFERPWKMKVNRTDAILWKFVLWA
jgi:hypothetical protein